MKKILSGIELSFPYEPYDVQLEYMTKVIDGLKTSKNCLLESPTGSGKTLSLLCASLSFQTSFLKELEKTKNEILNLDLPLKNEKPISLTKEDKSSVPKIFYGTRTHSQITQIIRELKKTSFKPIMDILASRKHYCINEEVRKSGNAINDECMKKRIYQTCRSYPNAENLSKSTKFKPEGEKEIWDMEDWIEGGKKIKACPYYAAQYKLGDAEIIFCPYNYLVDPNIRTTTHIELEGNIVIIDEAHNIEDVSRDAASFSVEVDDVEIVETVNDLKKLMNDGFIPKSMEGILVMLLKIETWMSHSSRKMNSDIVIQKDGLMKLLNEWSLTKENFISLHGKYQKLVSISLDREKREEEKVLSEKSLVIIEHLFCVFEFMFQQDCKFINDYNIVLQKSKVYKNHKYIEEVTLNLWCMNPRVAFHEIAKKCRSIILTSGTLSPMDSFSSELEVDFDYTFEGSHVINLRKQLFIGSLSKGPNMVKMNASFKESSSEKFQDSLGELILDSCKNVKFGVLCFFPSYAFMDKLKKRWEFSGTMKKMLEIKDVIFEGRGIESGSKFDAEMKRFYKSIENYEQAESEGLSPKKTGGLCLAVCRGKISEGIDFANNRARLVICVGIPFPNVRDLKVDLKKRFNNEYNKGLNGNKWYCQQAYRAINQAIGRCIRHKGDYGSVFLVDERFNEKQNINGLSKWMRAQVKSFDGFKQSQIQLKAFLKNVSQGDISDDILDESLLSSEEFDIDTSDDEDPLFATTQKMEVESPTFQNESLTQSYVSSKPIIPVKAKSPKTPVIIPPKRKFQKNVSLEKIITRCSHCSGILCEIDSTQSLKKIKEKPYLENLMKNLGHFSLEVYVSTNLDKKLIKDVIPNDEIVEIEKSENKVKIGKFEFEIPNPTIENGKKCVTGWIESDQMVYQLLFCSNCSSKESNVIGVKIIASNLDNIQHLNQVWIFKNLDEEKNKKPKI
eukprot:gene8724-672_t